MEIAQKNCGLGTSDDQNKGNFLCRFEIRFSFMIFYLAKIEILVQKIQNGT